MFSKGNLNKFLKSLPKYAGMAGGLGGVTMIAPVVAVPIANGMVATYLAAAKKVMETVDEAFSEDDIEDTFRKKLRGKISLSTRKLQ